MTEQLPNCLNVGRHMPMKIADYLFVQNAVMNGHQQKKLQKKA